jgi:hypothetical protein
MVDRVGQQLGNYHHNLPVQLTPLIGRKQEIQVVCALLRRPEVRLVTLTGTGGVGKTRLGLEVAADLLDEFADGAYFVPLAPISDPELVVPTIAQVLGIQEAGERPLLDLLKAYLRDKHMLLLLDNFEQILLAVTGLSNLLADCPHLKVLVTSRAVLHIRGEHEFPVPPLALPDLTHLPGSEALSQYAAVALFLQCAQAARPDFQVTSANARTIAAICALGWVASGHRTGSGTHQTASSAGAPGTFGPSLAGVDERSRRCPCPAANAAQHAYVEL